MGIRRFFFRLFLSGMVIAMTWECHAAINLIINSVLVQTGEKWIARINVDVNVASGSQSRLDFILDYAKDGIVNGEDFPLFSFLVTEGKRFKISGLAYPNIPGDLDDAQNGHLSVFVPIGMDVQYFVPLIVQIDDGFGAVRAPLNFQPTQTGYEISGKVYRDFNPGLGTPSLVFIEYMDENNEHQTVVATDSSGNYSTRVPWAGTYVVYALNPRMVAVAANGGGAQIQRGEGLPASPVNLNLTSIGLRKIRGKVKGPLQEGIPLALIYASAGDPDSEGGETAASIAIADLNGNYELPVVNGQWFLEALNLHTRGYVEDDDGIGLENIAVTGWDVAGKDITALHPIKSLVTGRLLRGDTIPPQALPGVTTIVHQELGGGSERWFDAKGSNTDGSFVLGAFDGQWFFQISPDNLPVGANLICPSGWPVTIPSFGVLDLGDLILYPACNRVQHFFFNGGEFMREAGESITPQDLLGTAEHWNGLGRTMMTRPDFLSLIRGS